jgi:hypothetical protein
MNKKTYIAEYITRDIVTFIIDDTGVSISEAMNLFYNSVVFDKLQDFETGLYSESSAYVYDLYLAEKAAGHLVQLEV